MRREILAYFLAIFPWILAAGLGSWTYNLQGENLEASEARSACEDTMIKCRASNHAAEHYFDQVVAELQNAARTQLKCETLLMRCLTNDCTPPKYRTKGTP